MEMNILATTNGTRSNFESSVSYYYGITYPKYITDVFSNKLLYTLNLKCTCYLQLITGVFVVIVAVLAVLFVVLLFLLFVVLVVRPREI